jgi:hypothetical protein
VSLTGILADGTKFTAASKLRADDKVPFFAQLYRKFGSLGAELQFADEANSDASAEVLWIRPELPRAQHYPDSWPEGLKVDGIATRYVAAEALDFGQGAPDPSAGNAQLTLSEGLLSSEVTKPVDLDPVSGKIQRVPLTDTSYSLRLDTSRGAKIGTLTGTFTHSDTTLTAFRGVLLSKGTMRGGYGYFLSTPAKEKYKGTAQGGKMRLSAGAPEPEPEP